MALEPRAGLKVVGEAEDGIDAVRQAQELQPDLILLDIGLPKLNGIAAALRICTLAPDAKLLFISLESSDAAVREAFQAGAHGYIHRLRAQLDLIPAVEAVLAGKASLGIQVPSGSCRGRGRFQRAAKRQPATPANHPDGSQAGSVET